MKAKQEEAPKRAAKAAAPAEKPGWTELPKGAVVLQAGNGVKYQTGDWRSERPDVNIDKCIHCLFCWVYCPDNAVIVENEKFKAINYYHCKGCGICAVECPAKCIAMGEEGKFQGEEETYVEVDGRPMPQSVVGKGG